MTSPDITIAGSGSAPVAETLPRTDSSRAGRSIFHPAIDFLCLGGASLVLLPLLMLLPETTHRLAFVLSIVLANVINHPHFAASYQIFYRGFFDKLRGDALSRPLRVRYIFAGLVLPALLIGFFAYAFLTNNARMLGWGANLMLLLVGWHYTKQGYGMLIVDSVYRRRFFTETEKAIFRYNAYGCWLSYWLYANWIVSERQLWGLAYYSLHVPQWVLYTCFATTLATTALTFGIFARRLGRGGDGLPLTGTMAYITSLYIWLAARFVPVALLFVPAFHSLQYLLIVGRYETNRSRARAERDGDAARSPAWPLVRFAAVATLLGATGFWWAPKLFDFLVDYDRATFGGGAFLFMYWIFINVHHYFIDNVIWRRDNPETGEYLFGPKPARA